MSPSTERILRYIVAIVCVAAGGALLAGWFQPSSGKVGLACGTVLLLLGINRYLSTRWQSQQRPRWRRFEDDPDSEEPKDPRSARIFLGAGMDDGVRPWPFGVADAGP